MYCTYIDILISIQKIKIFGEIFSSSVVRSSIITTLTFFLFSFILFYIATTYITSYFFFINSLKRASALSLCAIPPPIFFKRIFN